MRSFLKLALASALLVLVSCEARFDWPWLNKEGRGSGKTITEDRTIAAFSQVRLQGVGKLVFDPSIPAGTIRITANDETMKTIRVVSADGLLSIDEENLGFNAGDIQFCVAPPSDLSGITLEGMGSVEAKAPLVTTADLSVVLEGMGKMELEVDAPSVRAEQQGSGELVVRGKAGRVVIAADGLGKVDTSKLVTAAAEVSSNGVGEVRVYASETLKVRADGLGAVRFSGNPKTTDIQTEGLTKVKAADRD